MARVLVTGASGFVGRELVPALTALGHEVRTAHRKEIGELGPNTDWPRVLGGIEAVVHLAGVAHNRQTEAVFERANLQGTQKLALDAARADVKRFIFLSSVKAAADRSADRALTEADAPKPETPYGRSKLAAERMVLAFQGLQPVILRPPLVFSARAKANFRSLLQFASSGLPLPFAGLSNRRSLIALPALTAAVAAVLDAPKIKPGVFYVATQPALSTGEMIELLRAGMGKAPGTFSVPAALLKLAPHTLTESLEISDAAFRAAYTYGRYELDAREALRQTGRDWVRSS